MKYAVGFTTFFENDLKIEIIQADTPKEAIAQHSEMNCPEIQEWLAGMPDSVEGMKRAFFDGDGLMDVVEVPDGH